MKKKEEIIIQSFLVDHHHLLYQPYVPHEIDHNVFYVSIQIAFFVLKKIESFFQFKISILYRNQT